MTPGTTPATSPARRGPAPHPPFGQPVRRREDRALITGVAPFVADLDIDNALHMTLVPSPVAHARIKGIETQAAANMPGVAAVLTNRDLGVPPVAHGFRRQTSA